MELDFAEVFATRVRHVRRTAYLLCGDWSRAEDLTQTTFAKFYAARHRVREAGAVDAYLRQTLTRTYIDDNRRLWRRERPAGELPEVGAGVGVGGWTGVTGVNGVNGLGEETADRVTLLAALAHVPPRQRACLVLRFFDDFSVAETAAALDCSEGTVKSQTARGLDTLRRLLGDAVPTLVTTATTGRDQP
jgi:RNA polymerase sigma factor (sigma-70 family)